MEVADAIAAAVPASGAVGYEFAGLPFVVVAPSSIRDVLCFLRDDPARAFSALIDVTAVDRTPADGVIEVIYVLRAPSHGEKIVVKSKVPTDAPRLPSVTSLWHAADWAEREVYDMFGVNFAGHPDLRRILLPEDWQGFPQRKDYPLEGPGELLMENPLDWLKLRQARDESTIE